jgi:hypothetical protein
VIEGAVRVEGRVVSDVVGRVSGWATGIGELRTVSR